MLIGLAFDLKVPGALDDDQEEFDPPETIDAIEGALRALGHDVARLGDGEPALRRLLEGARPDLVFNIAEGVGAGRCREARLPAALEMLGIPYTGSDPLTLALTLDKDCAKRVVASAGIATPRWCLVRHRVEDHTAGLRALPLPVIVKPAWEGSSKGILPDSVVDQRERLVPIIERCLRTCQQPALIEEFIDGDEVTVGIVGNRPPQVLGAMRVVPKTPQQRFVYDIEVKRDWQRRVAYESPPRLPAAQIAAIERAALNAYVALECRDVARIDFRVRDGEPFFIEANPLPGLSPEYGDLVLLARGRGIDHQALIARIVDAAMARQQGR